MRRVTGFGATCAIRMYRRGCAPSSASRHSPSVSFAFGILFLLEQWRGNGVGQSDSYGTRKRRFQPRVEGCSIRRGAGVVATAMSF